MLIFKNLYLNFIYSSLLLIGVLILPDQSLFAQQATPDQNCTARLEQLSDRQKAADSLIVRISRMMQANDSAYQCLLPYYVEHYVGPGKEKTAQYYYNLMANRQFRKGNYDSVRYYLQSALHCDSILGDSFLLSTDIGIKANLFLQEGQLDEAIEQYQLSLRLLDKDAKPTNANAMYSNLGVAFIKKGYYESALQNFRQALEYDRKRSNVYAVESGLILKVNIGVVLKNQEKYDEAIANLQGIADTIAQNNIQNAYISYLVNANLSSCYLAIDSLERADYYLSQAEVLMQTAELNPVSNYSSRVNLAYRQGDAHTMKTYLDKLADIFTDRGQALDAEYHADWGNYYALTGKKTEAIEQWETALQLLSQDSASLLKLDVLQALGKACEEVGLPARAAAYFSEALKHQQRIQEKNRVTAINDMLTVYAVDKYQAQLKRSQIEKALLLSRQKADRLRLGLALMAALGLLGGFGFYYRTSRLRQQGLQTEKKLLEQQQSQRKRELEFQKQQLLNRNLQMARIKKQVLELSERNFSDKKLLQRKLHMAMNESDLGDIFFKDFKLFYPGFAQQLTREYPDVSNRQLQYCSLIALGLSNQEIADILHVSVNSVEKARTRLADQFQLPSTANLSPMLRNHLLQQVAE